jgi:hypothetical protein
MPKLDHFVTCPWCKAGHNGATETTAPETTASLSTVVPGDGDLNICIECAGLSTYQDGQLERLTGEDYNDLPREARDDILRAQNMVYAVQARKRAH